MDITWTPRSVGPLFGLLSPEKQPNSFNNEIIRLNSSSSMISPRIRSVHAVNTSPSSSSSPIPSLRIPDTVPIHSNPVSASPSHTVSSPKRPIDHISSRNIQEIVSRKQWDPSYGTNNSSPSSQVHPPAVVQLEQQPIAHNTQYSRSKTINSPRNNNSLSSPLSLSSSSSSSGKNKNASSSSSFRNNKSSSTKKYNNNQSLESSASSILSGASGFSPSSASITQHRSVLFNTGLSSSLPPVQHNYISTSPSKLSHQSSISTSSGTVSVIEPIPLAEDIGIEVSLQAYLVSGTINEDFTGAYGYFASYDELPLPPGPNGNIRTVKDSFTLTQSIVPDSIFSHHTLRGSHAARLELHHSGIFRARLTHQAAGPSAVDRSINMDAVGKWVFLPGSSKIVLIPDDRTMRIAIHPLPGSETEEMNDQINLRNEENNEKDDGPPGGARVTQTDARTGLLLAIHKGSVNHNPELPSTREWISLQYPVFRVPS